MSSEDLEYPAQVIWTTSVVLPFIFYFILSALNFLSYIFCVPSDVIHNTIRTRLERIAVGLRPEWWTRAVQQSRSHSIWALLLQQPHPPSAASLTGPLWARHIWVGLPLTWESTRPLSSHSKPGSCGWPSGARGYLCANSRDRSWL